MRLTRQLILEKKITENLRLELRQEREMSQNLSLEMDHLESLTNDLLNENKILKSHLESPLKKLKSGLNYGGEVMNKISKAYVAFKSVQEELENLQEFRDFKT